MDTEIFANIIAIAEDKSISKAAGRLFISRSALNRQLLAVEQEIGLPLFKRVSNKLELTYAGEVFIRTARQVLSSMRDCTRLMQDISGNLRGLVAVGVTTGRATLMMKDILARFHQAFPHVSISFNIANSDELREMLTAGKIDIALIACDEVTRDLAAEPLSSEEIVLICSKDHPLAGRAGVDENGARVQCRLDWFRDDVFGLETRGSPMRVQVERLFADENFRPDTVIENCTTPLLMQLANEGICCTIFSERHLRLYDNVVGFSFAPRRYFDYSLAYRRDYVPNVAEQHFMELLREFYSA